MSDIFVTRSSMPSLDEYIEEIKELWNTRWLTNMGTKHKEFSESLKNYLEVDNVELFTNGHMALELTLQAMKLSGEVITTPFTFASTTHAIVRNGLTPVFCDINQEDYTIDASKIESLITDRTTAIVPVHVYGNVCDIEAIDLIAKKYNLKVLYDAAHAFGVKYKGKSIGSFGDASCFSFHATKIFHSIEGGAACFRDPKLGADLFGLKNFGIRDPETVDSVGANAKMNEFCAAMGICNLRHVTEEIAKRRLVAERYRYHLEGIPGIKLNKLPSDATCNYSHFPIVFDDKVLGLNRDEILDMLAVEGIRARKYFYPITNTLDCYKGQFSPAATPIALDISKRILTLPLYADLPLEDVDRICATILYYIHGKQ